MDVATCQSSCNVGGSCWTATTAPSKGSSEGRRLQTMEMERLRGDKDGYSWSLFFNKEEDEPWHRR